MPLFRRLCNARSRKGTHCQQPAVRGSLRCHWHGARCGRPKGIPEHPNSRAARLEGRRRWVERMNEAKAAGLITRFPNGARARSLPPLAKDKTLRRAQRILEKAKAMADRDIAKPAERPWSELTHPEKLDKETGVSLDITAKILNDGAELLERQGLTGTDIKLVTLVRDTALAVIGNQIKIDTATLTASGPARRSLKHSPRGQRRAMARPTMAVGRKRTS
jgi:hypothetical protein